MHILIAAKRAPNTPGRRNGGVQTWIATVAAELHKRGHVVDITGAADMPPGDGYDLGIFANPAHTQQMARYCRRTILICHGIVEDERPLPGFDATAFTSEGVKRHWGGAGPIIRQPIDLEFWCPGSRERSGIVRYAARGGLEWLPEVAASLGLPFVHIRNVSHEAAREALQSAAVVLASGRCALEAMACGAPTIICDERSYQGPLMGFSTAAQMRENFSGRGGIVPTIDNVASAISGAIAGRQGQLLNHVLTFHDVQVIVDNLMFMAAA